MQVSSFTLKYKSLECLRKRHSDEDIASFEKNCEKELEENSILVYVPREYHKGIVDSFFQFLHFLKPVFQMGLNDYYFFLDKLERKEIHDILSKNTKLLEEYKDCITPIYRDMMKPRKSIKKTTTTTTTTKRKVKTRVLYEEEEKVNEEEEEEEETRRELILLKQTRDWALMRKGLMQEWSDMNVELALERKENSLLRKQLESQENKINLLCETMGQFIQSFQQQQLQLQQQPRMSLLGITPKSSSGGGSVIEMRKITSVEEWIGPNLYGQPEFTTENRTNFSKWDGLFCNQEITPNVLQRFSVYCSFHQETQNIRLGIRLSYEYPLKMILTILESYTYGDSQKEKYFTLIKACPQNYRIVLLATLSSHDQYFNEENNRINLHVILFHCQAILSANQLNTEVKAKSGEQYLVQLCKEQDTLLKPDFTILDTYFPSSSFYGTNTFLSFYMGLNLVKANPQGTGDGIGSNKSCAFCRMRVRMTKNVSGGTQKTHQPKKCPLLACIGNNEATIILAMRDILLKSEKKQYDTLKNTKSFFGVDDSTMMVDRQELNLNNTTCFRHPTPEEFASGDHINGLRLNKNIYIKARIVTQDLLKVQFQSNLFTAPISPLLKSIFSNIHVEGLNVETATMATLVLDTDGKSFLETKLNNLAKASLKKRKTNPKKEEELKDSFTSTNQLFFSLKNQYNEVFNESLQRQCQFYSFEREQQQQFISTFIYPSSNMCMDMNVDFSEINV